MHTSPYEVVTAVILAGGRARRMRGHDKGLLKLQGRPLAAHIAEQMTTQCRTLLINANRHPRRYRALGYPVIPDRLTDFPGPLAGMHIALHSLATEWLITLPCDGPVIADDYVARMFAATARRYLLAVAKNDQRLQPVYALIHRSLVGSLEQYLHSGGRKIDRWYQQYPYAEVDFSQTPHMFENINTPQQYAAVQVAMRHAIKRRAG